ncbi:MAG: hypothetical protein IJ366_01295 [Clostridia bacterium]|nr:hypothetical protein [Clostridia bacterium]
MCLFGNGSVFGNSSDSWVWIIIIILILACCGNNGCDSCGSSRNDCCDC